MGEDRGSGKFAISLVSEVDVGSDVGDVEVYVAIVVEIGGFGSLAVRRVGNACLVGHIGEAPVAFVTVKHVGQIGVMGFPPKIVAVEEVYVEVAVGVVIEKCHA